MRKLHAGLLSTLLTLHFSPACTAAAASASPAIPSAVVLPADFPAGFAVYSTVIDTDQKLVTLRYANAQALQAARTGVPRTDGSMIVVAKHALVRDANRLPLAKSRHVFTLDLLRQHAQGSQPGGSP